MNKIIASFSIFLLLFTLIGVLSSFRSKKTNSDYLLAGSKVSPWLAGLSAVATNNSGYMFIGMIGYTYLYGLSSGWLLIGWIIGDFAASLFIHKRIVEQRKATNSLSFSELLSRFQKKEFKIVRYISALIIVVFLSVYASAQLKAGSKALNVLFNWDISTGAIIGAVIVVIYCFSGGIRASIWTDAAQSLVMFIAMAVIAVEGVNSVGGLNAMFEALNAVSPTYMGFSPDETMGLGFFVTVTFFLGWFFGGFATIGQPHIMVRFMALSGKEGLKKAKFYYYFWFATFSFLTLVSGLISRVVLPDTEVFDAELALPKVAMELLPEYYVGLVLAGLFAATMSTADSQILSCTAAFTRDLVSENKCTYLLTKFITILITAFVLLIALFATENVFNLVLIAWSGLGACFAPILIVYALNYRIKTEVSLILSMFAGLFTIVIWRYYELNVYTYEIFPGIIFGLVILFLVEKTYAKLFSQ